MARSGMPHSGDQDRLRKLALDPGAQGFPKGDGGLLARVLLDERASHVDAEAGGAHFQPEAHDFEHLLADLARGRAGALHLPGPLGVGLGEAVIEGRLAVEKVGDKGAVALGKAAHGLQALARRVPDQVGPDEPVAELVALGHARHHEPGMLNGGVPRHQVQADAHAALLGFAEEPGRIRVACRSGRDLHRNRPRRSPRPGRARQSRG